MDIFVIASRMKLRFKTKKCWMSVEDLWDLPLSNKSGVSLDEIAKSLNKAIKDTGEESFVGTKSSADTALDLKFEIVKTVIKIKLEEIESTKIAAERRIKKQRILEILARKSDATLEEASVEDLQAMLSDL